MVPVRSRSVLLPAGNRAFPGAKFPMFQFLARRHAQDAFQLGLWLVLCAAERIPWSRPGPGRSQICDFIVKFGLSVCQVVVWPEGFVLMVFRAFALCVGHGCVVPLRGRAT